MSGESPKMSQATKELLLKVRKMVPPMLEKFHKGMPNQFTAFGVQDINLSLLFNDCNFKRTIELEETWRSFWLLKEPVLGH
jgi:hypothetical protein